MKPIILLVEDNENNRYLAQFLLEREGFSVALAVNGKQALEAARLSKPDLVVMDIQMPEMDGYEAVAILRKKGYKRPIAALTAHALRSEKAQSLERGFDEYLTKPVNLPVLVNTVKRLSEA